jgi:hypothetical protein
MPGVLDLLRVLVRPNSDEQLIGLHRIPRATQLLLSQGLAEPGCGHLWVKSQNLDVAVDGFFEAP